MTSGDYKYVKVKQFNTKSSITFNSRTFKSIKVSYSVNVLASNTVLNEHTYCKILQLQATTLNTIKIFCSRKIDLHSWFLISHL